MIENKDMITRIFILNLTAFILLSCATFGNIQESWSFKNSPASISTIRGKRESELFCQPIDDLYTMSPPLSFNGNCYYVSVNETYKKGWQGAKSYCESKNSALITITAVDEMDFLKTFALKRFQNLSVIAFWIQNSAQLNFGPPSVKNESFNEASLPFLCPEVKFRSTLVADELYPDLADYKVIYTPIVLRHNQGSASCGRENYFICKTNYTSPQVANLVEGDDQSIMECNISLSLSMQNPVAIYKTPNFPSPYPPNMDCHILIINQDPSTVINVDFESFSLEPSLGCTKDRLEISSYMADSKYNKKLKRRSWPINILDSALLRESSESQYLDLNKGRYCGDWNKKIKLLKFQTNGNNQFTNLLLRFVTNELTSSMGFSFKAYLDFKKDASIESKIKSKVITLKDQNGGTFSSPNYPYAYFGDINLTVIIEAPPQARIEIKFTYFDVEYQEECLYDFISVYDKGGIGFHRFCGKVSSPASLNNRNNALKNPTSSYKIVSADSEPIDKNGQATWSPFDFVSTGDRVIVNFHSDHSINGLGFVFKWKILDTKLCTRDIIATTRPGSNGPIQIIASFPRLEIPYLKCRTRIKSPLNTTRIYAEIYDIKIRGDGPPSSCLQEYILMRDGFEGPGQEFNYSHAVPIPTGQLIGNDTGLIICPKDGPGWITKFFSVSNILDIYYIKNRRDNIFLGYKIKFYTTENLELQEYLYTYQNHMGLITSLNYPLAQPSKAKYRIIIVASQKGRIKLYSKGITFQSVRNDTLSTLERFKRSANVIDSSENSFSIIDPFGTPNGSAFSQTYIGIRASGKPANPDLIEGDLEQNGSLGLGSLDETPNKDLILLTESKLHVLIVEIATSNQSLSPIMFLWELLADDGFRPKVAQALNPFPDCSFNLCSNNGTCTADGCSCKVPYKDKFCLSNPCESNPCVYGVCKVTTTSYTCDCDEMHWGPSCQYDICDTNICSAQGICHLENGTEICVCYPGYAGDRCDQTFPIIKDLSPSEKFFQEPFWMGIFLVIIVLIILGLIMLCQKKWVGEYKLICCDDCFARKLPNINTNRRTSTTLVKNDNPSDGIDVFIDSNMFPRRTTSPDIGVTNKSGSSLDTKPLNFVRTSTESNQSQDTPPPYSSIPKGSVTSFSSSILLTPLLGYNKLFNRRNKGSVPKTLKIAEVKDIEDNNLLVAYSSLFHSGYERPSLPSLNDYHDCPPALLALRSPINFSALSHFDVALAHAYNFSSSSPAPLVSNFKVITTSHPNNVPTTKSKKISSNPCKKLKHEGTSNLGYQSSQSTSPAPIRNDTTSV